MFNKLHNGNTEALPLIRKEKSIAIVNSHLAMLVLYYADDMAAFRQSTLPCSETQNQAVQLFCELSYSNNVAKN